MHKSHHHIEGCPAPPHCRIHAAPLQQVRKGSCCFSGMPCTVRTRNASFICSACNAPLQPVRVLAVRQTERGYVKHSGHILAVEEIQHFEQTSGFRIAMEHHDQVGWGRGAEATGAARVAGRVAGVANEHEDGMVVFLFCFVLCTSSMMLSGASDGCSSCCQCSQW